MKHSIQFAILLLSTCGLGQAQDVNDFFSGNGSFELGPHVNPLTFDEGINRGWSYQVPGWSMLAGGRSPQWLEGPEAQDGNRYLRLSSQGGTTTNLFSSARIFGDDISHTPFTIGDTYELVFWAAGGVGNAVVNKLLVNIVRNYVSETVVLPLYTQEEFDALGGPLWTEYVIPFTAVAESPNLYLTALSSNSGGSTSLYLDNISFRAVPEPGGALLVLGAGLGWLLAGRTRKRQLARA